MPSEPGMLARVGAVFDSSMQAMAGVVVHYTNAILGSKAVRARRDAWLEAALGGGCRGAESLSPQPRRGRGAQVRGLQRMPAKGGSWEVRSQGGCCGPGQGATGVKLL